jgi:metal-responsive CopG/Arc/MetJ family transcriptional regulator
MSVITVRLPDKLLHDLDTHAHAIHLQRAEYIRLAIEHMNMTVKNKERIERLKKASLRVRKESMRINKEFSRVEHDPKD